jgi:hypothetical protein
VRAVSKKLFSQCLQVNPMSLCEGFFTLLVLLGMASLAQANRPFIGWL